MCLVCRLNLAPSHNQYIMRDSLKEVYQSTRHCCAETVTEVHGDYADAVGGACVDIVVSAWTVLVPCCCVCDYIATRFYASWHGAKEAM